MTEGRVAALKAVTSLCLALSLCLAPAHAREKGEGGAQLGATERTDNQSLHIVTLGTAGGPPPHSARSQPATALQIGEQTYLVDAGEGAGYQLQQAGIPVTALRAVFVTHLHWDHTLGLDYLMAVSWMRNRRVPLPLLGPPGMSLLAARQVAAVQVGEDIFRVQAPYRPPLASLFPVSEVADCAPQEVYRDDHVTVRSVCNSHFSTERAPPHSYGEDVALSFRFDTPQGSVTFTGDTGPSAELDALAMGSDVLVSEVVDIESIAQSIRAASPNVDTGPLMVHMSHQHLTPQEIGQLATRAGVRKVILTHYVMGQATDIEILANQVREHFEGEVVAARDLQVHQINAP